MPKRKKALIQTFKVEESVITEHEKFVLYLLAVFIKLGSYESSTNICDHYFNEDSSVFKDRTALFQANLLRLRAFAIYAMSEGYHSESSKNEAIAMT